MLGVRQLWFKFYYLCDQAHRMVRLSGGEIVRIPMEETHVRCLNLSVSVGVGLYEALRQLNNKSS